ncbi:Hsp20/alpha crystallin family protein [Aestuariibacter halophilus]|uniref:Hsp20/alpha crystallin family protein n=1 Tax=Fluctibacter halophilus TaxID=226011 RepID=A0ABS8GAU8_9ALTE|nr:Hsp20/alpha crystallin family protein [Aestuariibacter halophilus]MCC2617554.1 Hsp20/alpha crystallin family protein [Aestuariibacter halophilus]
MSNLPISNRHRDDKPADTFPRLFGDHFFDDFLQRFSSHFPLTRQRAKDMDAKLGFVDPNVDITENKEAFILTAELPGLDKNDIKLDLSDGVLSLSGEKKFEQDESKDDSVHVMERRYGSFQRSFRLPNSVDQDAIKASFKNGVLSVYMPKSPQAKAQQRKIDIEH